MNSKQILGQLRYGKFNNGVVLKTMTKEEMDRTPHEKRGDFMFLEDGSEWIWDDRFNHWARWK